jgi:hypothetical protein
VQFVIRLLATEVAIPRLAKEAAAKQALDYLNALPEKYPLLSTQ